MKNITSQLLSFLRTYKQFNKSDLFQIELTNGLNIMATSSQRDLTLPVTAQPTPKNLLLWSQDVEQSSAWSNSTNLGVDPAITADAVNAPDGSLSADKLSYPGGGSSDNYLGQDLGFVPVANRSYTFSAYVRADSAVSTFGLRLVQGTGENDTTKSLSLTTQWQRFSLTITPSSVGTGHLFVRYQNQGTGAVTVYVWGAQVEQASSPTSYSPTWSNYTSNLLLQSQNFNQSPWVPSGTVVPALTPAAAIAPDGTLTATRVNYGTVGLNQFSDLIQNTSVPAIVNLPVIFSVWMKTVSGTATIFIRGDNGHPQDDTAQTVTNVWQRFSVSVAPSTTANLQAHIYSTNQTGPSIYIWGAQLEFAQQQQPNFLVWSQDLEDSAWTKNQLTVAPDTVTVNAPDGSMTADELDPNVGATDAYATQSINNLLSTGQSVMFSVWLTVVGSSKQINIALSDGVGSPTELTVTINPGWQRFSVQRTLQGPNLSVFIGSNGSWPVAKGTVYAWGAQLEIGSSVSPYASNYGVNMPGGSVVSPSNPTTYQASIPTLSFAGPMNRTFYSTKFGVWERGAVTSEASYQPKSNTMDLILAAPQSVNYPGTTIPMTQVVLAGLFEKALVTVYTVYWPLGGQPTDPNGIAMGSVVTFLGEITKVRDSSRKRIVFEVADMLYRLNTEVPIHVIQSGCRHRLFDVNCALNQASFAFNTTLVSGSSALVLNLAAALNTASFFVSGMTFSQGSVLFTSGQNSGLRAFIKNQNSNTQLLLSAPLPFPVATGDALTIYPGCDLSLATCINTYNNKINFGGMPFVPSPEQSL